ncbi:unnamed protein product [Clonostachys chloroleuca]|uniref:Uncharacterized protein n=1 Tax=Clonostachys chloroleuca TaxID=1926264 RepID=A0AA35PYJ3_9HYPO|nr:unnamed protein product [Clonostachys chloroleuca]
MAEETAVAGDSAEGVAFILLHFALVHTGCIPNWPIHLVMDAASMLWLWPFPSLRTSPRRSMQEISNHMRVVQEASTRRQAAVDGPGRTS